MLLQEKMKNTRFSASEQFVVEFILSKQELIKNYSTTAIASETYTSPSILIRISKKLGFHGYNEFKEAFLNEVEYLKTNFQDLDANTPFTHTDSIMNIASKISQIKKESINDTLSLIHHDELQKTIRLIQKANTVKIFTVSNLCFQAEEFTFKLRHIGKKTETYSFSNTMYQEAKMSTPQDCAICLSYSGESGELIKVAEILKSTNVPIIAITSIGENRLTELSDVTLRITTRERSYSKIAGFSSLESISLLLDIIYSCYFKIDYERNYKYKIQISKETELRDIQNKIIQED